MENKANLFKKVCSLVITAALLFQQAGFAQVSGSIDLSGYLSGLKGNFAQDVYRPCHLRYFSYDNLTDNFKILVEKGYSGNGTAQGPSPTDDKLKQEANKLLEYFLTGVSLQDDMFWVNLRPDSQDQIIDNWLEKTDVGKIMLEADVQLKKDTALWTSPETAIGRKYWDKLYKKAAELYGYDNVTIPTLTRPWIVPGEIIVRESKDSAYVYKAVLKVMLEEDYLKSNSVGDGLASSHNQNTNKLYEFNDPRAKELNTYSTQLIRELIIPKLTKEVNSSKKYAALRQVYYSLILSRWFKARFGSQRTDNREQMIENRKKSGYVNLINSNNLSGLTSKTAWSKEIYYKQYQKSFSEGEYNIKEPVQTPTGQVIRSYFSGGVQLVSSGIEADMVGFVGKTIPQGLLSRPGNVMMQNEGSVLVSSGVKQIKQRELGDSDYMQFIPQPVSGKTSSAINQVSSAVDYATLDDVEVNGKTVLVRVDINVPVENGHIKDSEHLHQRVVESAKTIKELAEKGAKVVVVFHQGRPNDPDFMDNPFEHAKQIEKLVGRGVIAVDDLFETEALNAIDALASGEILVLKPVRAKDPSTENTLEQNPLFIQKLKSRIELFVNDAFSVSHRNTPSVTGFNGIPTIAGWLMQKELEGASNLLNPPHPHLVVVGGGKVREKYIEMSESLNSDKADKVIVGGRLANLALVAYQYDVSTHNTPDKVYDLAKTVVGEATADNLRDDKALELIPNLATLISTHENKIELPTDMVYLDGSGQRWVVILNLGYVPQGFNKLLSGIGPKTAEVYAKIAGRKENPFKSAFVIGPLSDTRHSVLFAETQQVLQAVSNNVPFWATGGGDTEELVTKQLGLTPTYSSLAGGALAEFKAGNTLPGVKILYDNNPKQVNNEITQIIFNQIPQPLTDDTLFYMRGRVMVVRRDDELSVIVYDDVVRKTPDWKITFSPGENKLIIWNKLSGKLERVCNVIDAGLKNVYGLQIDESPNSLQVQVRVTSKALEQIQKEGLPVEQKSLHGITVKLVTEFSSSVSSALSLPAVTDFNTAKARIMTEFNAKQTYPKGVEKEVLRYIYLNREKQEVRKFVEELFSEVFENYRKYALNNLFGKNNMRNLIYLEFASALCPKVNNITIDDKGIMIHYLDKQKKEVIGYWNLQAVKQYLIDSVLEHEEKENADAVLVSSGVKNELIGLPYREAKQYPKNAEVNSAQGGKTASSSSNLNDLLDILWYGLGDVWEESTKGNKRQISYSLMWKIVMEYVEGNTSVALVDPNGNKRYSKELYPGRNALNMVIEIVKMDLIKAIGDEREASSGIDGSTSLPLKTQGGIDFGGNMGIKYETGGILNGMDLSLPVLSLSELESVNIDSEIQRVKKMVSSGISPSGDGVVRLVSACKQKGRLGDYSSDLLLCFADACELAEMNGDESSADFKKALAVVDLLS